MKKGPYSINLESGGWMMPIWRWVVRGFGISWLVFWVCDKRVYMLRALVERKWRVDGAIYADLAQCGI